MAQVGFSGKVNVGGGSVDASTILGSQLTLHGNLSSDPEGGPLTYKWAIVSKPATSALTIATVSAANQSITADVAGSYELEMLVTDDKGLTSAKKSTLSIKPNLPLSFKPLQSRYSKAFDKAVMTSSDPNTLHIIDAFSGAANTLALPLANVVDMNLSPDGKLAAVLQIGSVSLIDVKTGALIRTTSISSPHKSVFVTNAGISYLIGGHEFQPVTPPVTVLDARAGTNLTATLGLDNSAYVTGWYGVYAPGKSRIFHTQHVGSFDLKYFDISPTTGKTSGEGSLPANQWWVQENMFLFEDESVLLSGSGFFFTTDGPANLGRITNIDGRMVSMSNSAATGETLLFVAHPGLFQDDQILEVYMYHAFKYTGSAMVPNGVLAMPVLDGEQSYGVSIFHAAGGSIVSVVQTKTPIPGDAAAKFYLTVK